MIPALLLCAHFYCKSRPVNLWIDILSHLFTKIKHMFEILTDPMFEILTDPIGIIFDTYAHLC